MALTPIQIKINAIKRLVKEESLYKQEVEEQEQYVAGMRKANADEYEIKKQVEVLEESKRMVPEVSKKVAQYKEDLATFLKSYTGTDDLAEAKLLLE